jgi:putative chitinase
MGQLIDAAKFAAFAPRALPGSLEALEAAAREHGLTGHLVLAHWLGQMRVESKAFSTLKESLNYSVDGLIAKFRRHRISIADCQRLGRLEKKLPGGGVHILRAADQEAIANLLYGGAFGLAQLGNTDPGDGWLFRGGGFKQITGRANYREAGHEDNPDVLRTDVLASAMAAANFFVRHRCIPAAQADDVGLVTQLVNGGAMALQERIAATAAAKRILL